MKTILTNNFFERFSSTVVFFTILSIPLYQVRIPFLNTSLSILSLFLIFLCGTLLTKNLKRFIEKIKKKNLFLTFSFLFLISFIPSLLIYPNIHALGVFVEWVMLPTLTGVLLWTHTENYKNQNTIFFTLMLVSLTVALTSLFFYLSDVVTYDNRLASFFLSPNHLAMFLSSLIFTSIAYFTRSEKWYLRYLCATSIILSTIIIILTQSLSTIIAITTALLLTFFLLLKNKKTFLIFFLITLSGLALFSYQKYLNSNNIFERNSFSSRLMIWDVSIYNIQKQTLIGYKLDHFQDLYLDTQKFYTPYLEWAVPTPHNIFLNFMISGGFFASLFFMLLCAYVILTGTIFYIKTKEQHILFTCAALMTIIFCGILDTPYWKNDLAVIFWITIALIMSPSPHSEQEKEQTTSL